MRQITVVIFFLSFVLLRPVEFQWTGLFYPVDDQGYFAHAAALVFGQFPFYDKEVFFGDNRPIKSIGPALLALPFAI